MIINHRVSEKLMDDVMVLFNELFNISTEEKDKLYSVVQIRATNYMEVGIPIAPNGRFVTRMIFSYSLCYLSKNRHNIGLKIQLDIGKIHTITMTCLV